MYFEVVTKTTPVEGLHYHARIRMDDGEILFRSANHANIDEAVRACELVARGLPGLEIRYISE